MFVYYGYSFYLFCAFITTDYRVILHNVCRVLSHKRVLPLCIYPKSGYHRKGLDNTYIQIHMLVATAGMHQRKDTAKLIPLITSPLSRLHFNLGDRKPPDQTRRNTILSMRENTSWSRRHPCLRLSVASWQVYLLSVFGFQLFWSSLEH